MSTVSPTLTAQRVDYVKRIKDVMGRLKIAKHQNIYDADFEYGKQPMRWEEFTSNGGAITHLPGAGGCAMFLPDSTTNPAALTIRQSRPYHRYQPGKSMFMATAINFGSPSTNQFQRVGFFDDSNGIFFEQGPANAGNPYGMQCVIRSDTNYFPNGTASTAAFSDVKFDFANWSDPQGIKNQINWAKIQMLWIEYAWYGAGTLRWGVLLDGEQYILHEVGAGNNTTYGGGVISGTGGLAPWSRTGNLPVRYEQRDSGTGSPATTMYHYGVSVIIEGESNPQRGFTYSYGMDTAIPRRYVTRNSTRFPVLSIQGRVMGTQEFSCIGGPAVSQANIATATQSYLTVSSVPYKIGGGVKSFDINATTTTITFIKPHGLLPSGGNVTLSGWNPSGINGTKAYTYQSPSTITITNSTAYTGAKGNVLTTGVSWNTNEWVGRSIYYLGTDTNYYVAKIISNDATKITFCDPQYVESQRSMLVPPSVGVTFTGDITLGSNQILNATPTGSLAIGQIVNNVNFPLSTVITDIVSTGVSSPVIVVNNLATATVTSQSFVANAFFTIGQVNRGQLLPQSLIVSADSLCVVELISSAPNNPVVIQNQDFQPLTNLGSANSFATRDVSGTSIAAGSGEVVYAFTTPAGGAGITQLDLTNFFPLFNSVTGATPDILTVAVSTKSTSAPGSIASAAVAKSSTFTATTTNTSTFLTAVSSSAGLYVGQYITGAGIPANTTITKIFTTGSTTVITMSASATAGATGITVTAYSSVISYTTAHNLAANDQITMSGFFPAGWNGTYTIASILDLYNILALTPPALTSATTLGQTYFTNGASVGAHLICQEAMS